MAAVLDHLKILHLFIKTDIKTVMVPVTMFAYFSVPHTTGLHFARGIFWTWFNLLYFCISNQVFDPEEDRQNKPWRPIPAGLISVRGANWLRFAVLPLCMGLSWWWGALAQCLTIAVLGSAYNDWNMGAHWAPRHIFVAAMYAAFNSGAARVASDSIGGGFDQRALLAHALNALVILTTIQAADFRDEAGDRDRGRATIPLLWPVVARGSMWVLLLVWSIVVSMNSTVDRWIASAFTLFGLVTGLRFQFLRRSKEDRLSYLWYDIWLCVAQVLPFV